jgi:uncharacterized tellurite resistance protein B-like protein
MQFVTLFLALNGIGRWLKRLRDVPDPPTTVFEPPPRPPTPEFTLPSVDRPPSPRRRAARGTAAWIPLSETVMVGGLTIPGGVYVGDTLAAVSQWGGTEPALIDPSLSVDLRRPDVGGQQMGYWPAYAEISPSSRGAYLRWLEAGRPGGAYVGYVFLFFYGIERRVIRDAANDSSARDEIPALLAEVERLRELYRDNGSFVSYSTDFLATARFTGVPKAVADLTAPRERAGWDIPLEVRLVAGAAASDGEPLPGEWALAWALHSPEIALRKPATRCHEEFADLFLARYSAQHGDGLIIKPNKTKLRLQYRPASASFGGAIDLDAGDLPDVTRLSGPTNKLSALVTSVTDDLDAYSRHVGRHDDRDSARAVALLPPELARERGAALVGRVLEAVPVDGDHVISAVSLTEILGPGSAVKLPKRDAAAVASLLAAYGIGLEPDIRVGATNFSHHKQAVLWREPDPAAPVGDGFAAATVLLHLGVTVGASDGEVSPVEQEHLEEGLERAFDLPQAGRRRLRAHLHWLLAEQPGIAGVKGRVGVLDAAQRELIARYLVAVAGADGHISPKEVDSLRRLYTLLDLDPESVHRDLHDLASGPVAVVSADPDAGDYAIPGEMLLDQNRLADVLSSTRQVSEVLTAVFVPDEPATDEPSESETPDSEDARDRSAVAGLDAAHATLVRRLAAQPSWARADFDVLAEELGLLGAGAIETVNDAAFTHSDGPLLEGEDPIELDGHVLKELLHA